MNAELTSWRPAAGIQFHALVAALLLHSSACGDTSEAPGGPVKPATTTWIKLTPGTFNMGSPSTERCRWSNEDHHPVTQSHWTLFPSTEVTRQQYKQAMGGLPPRSSVSRCTRELCPITMVTWNQAVAYCNRLSAQAGLAACYTCKAGAGDPDCGEIKGYTGPAVVKCDGYRLPTESEWEYAYRAGTSSPYQGSANSTCTGADPALDKIAWYDENAAGQVMPVGLKQTNAWGLYDLAGNVWEWMNDAYVPHLAVPARAPEDWGLRTIRGGSVGNYARKARAASRDALHVTGSSPHTGFRCVRTTARPEK